MALKVDGLDNIRETFSLTTPAAVVPLSGAAGTSRPFSSELASADTFWGTIRNQGEYSTGVLTYTAGTPNTLTQTAVWRSSNSNNVVTFSSGGTGEAFADPPSRLFDHLNMESITVTSAATTNIGAVQGKYITISGTGGPVTSYGATTINKERVVTHAGETVNHGAAIDLIGGVNWVTAAGDVSLMKQDASGNWKELKRRYASGRVVSASDGTVSLPAFTFQSDLDSGLYRIGANNIGYAVNGAKVLDISTTGLGVTGALSASGNASALSFVQAGSPDTSKTIDSSGSSVVVATGTNSILAIAGGLVGLYEQQYTGNTALYWIGSGAAILITSTGSLFVNGTTTPGAGNASVAYDGASGYRIYNNRGGSINCRVMQLSF